MNDKHNHIEPSPLTADSKGRISKPKFILTLFLTVVVSLSLIVGGTLSYFSIQNDHFITVDGKEVITPDIAQAIQSQLGSAPMSPQQKLSQLMQALAPRQQSLMWSSYAHLNGLNFQAVDLMDALKKTYEEEKEKYQKENKSYYNIPYLSFVQESVDIFNVQTILGSIIIPNQPDEYNINVEYTADNTLSTVKYKSIDIKDYLVEEQKKELETFYNKSANKIIGGKTLKVIAFDSSEQADKVAKDLQKDEKQIKAQFTDSTPKITISKKDEQAYIYLQNVNINEVTPSFTYKGKNYVGQVVANEYLEFKTLSQEDLLEIAKQYMVSLDKKEMDNIAKKIKTDLENNSRKSFIKEGTTAPIKISKSQDAKDSKSLSPLSFGSANNTEFFMNAFHQQGYKSPVLQYMDAYYTLEVIKRTAPVYPIPQNQYKAIENTIKQREDNLFFGYHNALMQKNAKVDVNMKNINKLLVPGGQ